MTVQLRAVDDEVLGREVLIRRTGGVSLILHNPRHLDTRAAVRAALELPLLTVSECDFLDFLERQLSGLLR